MLLSSLFLCLVLLLSSFSSALLFLSVLVPSLQKFPWHRSTLGTLPLSLLSFFSMDSSLSDPPTQIVIGAYLPSFLPI